MIGVIHGDEDAGLAIVDELRQRPVPEGVELWIVDSMNPDGVANQDRHNGNDVDLNRNFPYKWGPIGAPGDGQYAGPAPASEPETQAMVNFMQQLRPDITLWYHQDLFVVNPAQGREGRVRARYAELTGLPMGQITGGIYTGIPQLGPQRVPPPTGRVQRGWSRFQARGGWVKPAFLWRLLNASLPGSGLHRVCFLCRWWAWARATASYRPSPRRCRFAWKGGGPIAELCASEADTADIG